MREKNSNQVLTVGTLVARNAKLASAASIEKPARFGGKGTNVFSKTKIFGFF
jgi:hypothetical protein